MCRSGSLPYLEFCSFVVLYKAYPTKPLDLTPREALKVDSSVNPFVVFVTNVLYQLLVFGCPAIANVVFGNYGVLRLQEFKFLGACNLGEN